MKIEVKDLGRKFNRQWVFRHLDFRLEAGNSYTFIGPNGSGKSTLLQIIAGIMPGTEGNIAYHYQGKQLEAEHFFRHLVMAAPYLELIEELTLAELIHFHSRFKRFTTDLSAKDCAERMGLSASLHKPVKYFSSGMKQRLKLGLAFFSDTPVLMLDEPTSNLDAQGVAWYLSQVQECSRNRLLIICSNQPQEYAFCRNIIDLNAQ
ncbi:MAG: ATP-binding cassette domain-containing protein [Bacteroidota bacterium]